MEIGPAVFRGDPRRNGINAPRDASITLNFTEPVNVVGSFFNINCAVTGLHNDATVAGADKVYVITPNVNFLAGEQCTFTIFKDQIHDQDTDHVVQMTTRSSQTLWRRLLSRPVLRRIRRVFT